MRVIKQVLGRLVTLRKSAGSSSLVEGPPWAEYAVDFFILFNEDTPRDGDLPYRFEWSVPAAPVRSGWFAAEDVADAEDMGLHYFGIKPEEWSVPAEAVHTQG